MTIEPAKLKLLGKAAELQLLIDSTPSSTITLTVDFARQLVYHLTYWQRHQAEAADLAERQARDIAAQAQRNAESADGWHRAALVYLEQRNQAMLALETCRKPTLRGLLRAWWRAHVVGEL